MPKKISQLEPATDVTASDLIQIVDIEDTGMAVTGTNKKATAQLLANELAGIVSDGTISGSKVVPNFTTNSSISVNSPSTALSITQSGAGSAMLSTGGNALFQKDSATFVLSCSTAADSSSGSSMQFSKYRGTHASPSSVQSGDTVMNLAGISYDGSTAAACFQVVATIDGTVSTGITPTRIALITENTSGTLGERARITPDGNVGIGATSPSSKLHVAGDLTFSSATTATSAIAGTNGDVPAQVVGYLVVNINGTARKIPYYA